jgi:pilus assembly protein CpaB
VRRSLDAVRFSGAGLFFVGAALLALLAGFSVYGFLRSAAPTGQVFVVVRDLPPGAILADGDLKVLKVASGAVPDGAVADPKAVVGRRVRYGLVAGDLLREAHLVAQGNSDVSVKVAEKGSEYRAVMLPGELVPAVDRLVPGDQLELTGVLPIQDVKNSTTVALHVGTASVLDVLASKGQGGTDKTTVLVALPSTEISRLALTMRSGSLTVAVRGIGQNTQPAPPLRLDVLTGQAQLIPQPAAPAR